MKSSHIVIVSCRFHNSRIVNGSQNLKLDIFDPTFLKSNFLIRIESSLISFLSPIFLSKRNSFKCAFKLYFEICIDKEFKKQLIRQGLSLKEILITKCTQQAGGIRKIISLTHQNSASIVSWLGWARFLSKAYIRKVSPTPANSAFRPLLLMQWPSDHLLN